MILRRTFSHYSLRHAPASYLRNIFRKAQALYSEMSDLSVHALFLMSGGQWRKIDQVQASPAINGFSTPIEIGWRMAICGVGFGPFSHAECEGDHGKHLFHRSGGVRGNAAISRFRLPVSGAALVALCFGLFHPYDARYALIPGAAFTRLARIVVFSRLYARS